MMGHREKMTADEWDFLSINSRRVHFSDKGRSHRAKKVFSRRQRRTGKQEQDHGTIDGWED